MSYSALSLFVPRGRTGQAVKIERNWVPYSNILIPLITLSSINEEFWSSRQWWQASKFSWVMVFLTCLNKISLVLSKNECSWRKLLYFVNRLEIHQSTIWYAGLLSWWDSSTKRLIFQVIFFFHNTYLAKFFSKTLSTLFSIVFL